MNIENLFIKPQQEQPDYIKNEMLMKLQRSGYLKFDRFNNKLVLGSPVFDYADKIQKEISQRLINNQRALIQYKTEDDILSHLESLRTIKSLPLTLNFGFFNSEDAKGLLQAKTDYYLDFILASEKPITLTSFNHIIDPVITQNSSTSSLYTNTTQFGFNLSTSQNNYEIPQYSNIPAEQQEEQLVSTPNCRTVENLTELFSTSPKNILKAVLFDFNGKLVFLYIRGDLDASQAKIEEFLGGKIQIAGIPIIEKHGLIAGFAGIKGMKAHDSIVLLDLSVKGISQGITGGNVRDYHYINFDYTKYVKNQVYGDFSDRKEERVTQLVEFKAFQKQFRMIAQKPVNCYCGRLRVHILELLAWFQPLRDCDYYAVQGVEFKPEQGVYDERKKINMKEKAQIANVGGFKNFIVVGKTWKENGEMEVVEIVRD